MSVLTSYLIAIYSLFPSIAPDSDSSDSLVPQAGIWLHIDTLDLNLTGPCYDVSFYKDDIVFLKPGEAINCLTHKDQPDPLSARPLFANKQFSGSPASFSFRGDYKKGYYTRSLKKDEYGSVEKIFEMSIEDQKVSGLRQLSFTADRYRYLHPAVSSNDSMMVFSSDRLPTSGGLDLFVTRNTADGWSAPLSLGEEINSSGHERYAFLDSQNNLWFSSTGHSGYGGYDIFVCSFNGQSWEGPRNLGRTVNGPDSELGICFHPDKQVALFSRVDPSGSEGMAIQVSLNETTFIASAMEGVSARTISLIMQTLADSTIQTVNRAQAEPKKEVVQPPPPPVRNENPEPKILADPPRRITFRVQIKSSEKAESTPSVSIAGKSYTTYEYYYKGSYRITVGQFETVMEANAFRLQSKESGFEQAFVAAFRGNTRETDPSVFKQ